MDDRQALLRSRFEVGRLEACLFTYVIIAVVLAWLWGDSSQSGLIVWAVTLGIVAPLPLTVSKLSVSFRTWFKFVVTSEILMGFAWALLPLLAMPATDVNRALVCAALIGVLIAATASSSQFLLPHLAFVVPFCALSISGYLMAENPLVMPAVFLAISFAFSLFMAADFRSTHVELVDVVQENNVLVSELEDEHQALTEANGRLDRQAWFDSLTGLANRAAMNRHLEQIFLTSGDNEASGSGLVTVAYLDLDGFKQINDTQGHRMGDLVLIAVARRLESAVGTQALLCRLGGDEITVMGQDLRPDRLGERLAQVFDDPFNIEGRSMRIGAGIGVATTSVPCNPEELLRFADRALYRHKARTDRAVRYQVFDTDMLEELRSHEITEVELLESFDAGKVGAWLQPIVDISDGTIVAAEALARWEHPDGTRDAEQFISHLSERRLLGELADRMIIEAEDAAISLESQGVNNFRISVNIAPTDIEGVLRRHQNVHALKNLYIEVTEDQAAPDPQRVAAVLETARQAGAKVLVDDFGTGSSSLAITTTLPIDGLKIDKSFVQNLNDERSRAVVQAIVGLGDSLGLIVIAEGVESAQQAQALRALGVNHAQGFLYAPAVPASQLIEWVVSAHRLGSVLDTELAGSNG